MMWRHVGRSVSARWRLALNWRSTANTLTQTHQPLPQSHTSTATPTPATPFFLVKTTPAITPTIAYVNVVGVVWWPRAPRRFEIHRFMNFPTLTWTFCEPDAFFYELLWTSWTFCKHYVFYTSFGQLPKKEKKERKWGSRHTATPKFLCLILHWIDFKICAYWKNYYL